MVSFALFPIFRLKKTSGFFLCLFVFSAIFAANWFHADIHLRELKGNRVKVPNSPAAVKLQFQLIGKDFYATDVTYIGKVPVRESVRRPAIIHVWSTSRVREANTNK